VSGLRNTQHGTAGITWALPDQCFPSRSFFYQPEMNKAQNQVAAFMSAAGQDLVKSPTIPIEEVCKLRVDLILEEADELDTALINNDIVEVADAIGDLLYVVLGTAIACGINIAPIFEEIHRSNMTKFIDGHRREDGKWIKGPSYTPANLTPIIEAQIKEAQYPELH
jgi:predicted HAD superfamily Cof-like phosphohydrolase